MVPEENTTLISAVSLWKILLRKEVLERLT